MIRISILYPNAQGSSFDFDYYLAVHMPKSISLLSAAPGFRSVSVERGISGGHAGSPPVYVAICHYEYDTLEAFMAAFAPHAEVLQGDIVNYSSVQPLIQINEICIAR